jgi:hypothetical protein
MLFANEALSVFLFRANRLLVDQAQNLVRVRFGDFGDFLSGRHSRLASLREWGQLHNATIKAILMVRNSPLFLVSIRQPIV